MNIESALKRFTLLVLACVSQIVSLTASAQANWLVLHNSVVEPDVTLAASTHTEINILVSNNKQILCAIVEKDIALLLLASSTIGHGHLIFRQCKTWILAKESPFCKPVEPILFGGLELIILHNNKNYILVEGLQVSAPLAIIKFGGLCALPKENEVTDALVLECGHLQENGFVGLDCKNHQVTQLVRQAPAALFPADTPLFGGEPVTLDGIIQLTIDGPDLYVGRAWGGHV